MKKLLLTLAAGVLIHPAFSSEFKNNTNLTFSVTPIDRDETDDVQFGGAYFLAESTMSDDYVTLGGKLYYRLNSTDSKENESQKVEIKRAYAKVRPFGNRIFEIAVGKLYSYYLPGGYFSLTETYTGSARWGKTGIGVKSEVNGFTFGLALPETESYVAFKKDWGLNASVSYNFSSLSKEVPLTLGANVLYSAAGNGNSDGSSDGKADVNSVSEKDFSECFSLDFSKKNFGIFKNFSVFMAFSHNTVPYVSSSVFKTVANYSNKEMKNSNLFSLAFRPAIGSVKITSESEAGHSVEGNMVPFYSALQVYFPVYGILALKPMAGYYAAFNTCDSSKSFDTWEFYPRFMLEFEKWTVTAGWDMFYKEISDNDYRWLWTVPVTAKLKIGE
ncbi:hypothetical protein [Treponema sp.]|uniref:hypothetical protein n=1 Tax=Treponema sp. TaxID=166 RepID=UPI00388D4719